MACLGCIATAGCGPSGSSVSGKITLNGSPVSDGYVTFFPEDGKSPAQGAQIKDGAYSVSGVVPGPKIMTVEASGGNGPSVLSSADMEKLPKEWRAKAGPDGIIRTETVSQSTPGNNQKVNLKPGAQAIDMSLTTGK
jgi:hypothetical protein